MTRAFAIEGGRKLRRVGVPPGLRFADLFRKKTVDAVDEIRPDPRDDLVGLDGNRDVMDEVDEHAEAREREEHAERDRQMGDEGDFVCAADGAQNEQAVEERRDESAEHELVGGVAHEVAQQPGAELRRSERQGDEGQ